MKRIYLVEDEHNLRTLLVSYLEKEGYEVTAYADGLAAQAAISNTPDLWVLDIMLPGMDGYSLIKEIKKTSDTPVLFMSARSAELDRVVGLEMGSDDYLPKPFLPRELVLRVNRLLKATNKTDETKIPSIIGPYTVFYDKRVVTLGDEEITLTVKEFETLCFMIENMNKAISRSQVIDSVWGLDYFGSERVVDDTLRRLRKKMPQLQIEAVYGYGYRFKME